MSNLASRWHAVVSLSSAYPFLWSLTLFKGTVSIKQLKVVLFSNFLSSQGQDWYDCEVHSGNRTDKQFVFQLLVCLLAEFLNAEFVNQYFTPSLPGRKTPAWNKNCIMESFFFKFWFNVHVSHASSGFVHFSSLFNVYLFNLMLNEAGSLKLEVQIHVGWSRKSETGSANSCWLTKHKSHTLTCTLGLKELSQLCSFSRTDLHSVSAGPLLLACAQHAPMCGSGNSRQQSGRTCNR